MVEEVENQGQDETGDAGDDLDEADGQPEERRRKDFQAIAVQNLQRARKSLSGPDADVSPRATMLVQSAVGWALLDLAEAIRSHGRTDPGEPAE